MLTTSTIIDLLTNSNPDFSNLLPSLVVVSLRLVSKVPVIIHAIDDAVGFQFEWRIAFWDTLISGYKLRHPGSLEPPNESIIIPQQHQGGQHQSQNLNANNVSIQERPQHVPIQRHGVITTKNLINSMKRLHIEPQKQGWLPRHDINSLISYMFNPNTRKASVEALQQILKGIEVVKNANKNNASPDILFIALALVLHIVAAKEMISQGVQDLIKRHQAQTISSMKGPDISIWGWKLKEQRPLLGVAEDKGSDTLVTLILNKPGVKICEIKASGFDENRKEKLQVLATTLAGGQLIMEELGMNIDRVEAGPAQAIMIKRGFKKG